MFFLRTVGGKTFEIDCNPEDVTVTPRQILDRIAELTHVSIDQVRLIAAQKVLPNDRLDSFLRDLSWCNETIVFLVGATDAAKHALGTLAREIPMADRAALKH